VSFAERNKRWLLPCLGLLFAGVLWMNLPALAPEAVKAPVVNLDSTKAPIVERPDQAPEAPSPEDNDTLPLLLAGRLPLNEATRRPPRAPELHPDQWVRLCQAPRALGAGVAKVWAPPPVLDFLLETPSRREAWMNGKPYRQGDTLEGGYVLKRIGPGGVVLSGPAGDLAVPLRTTLAKTPAGGPS